MITPKTDGDDLNIKFHLYYDRLRTCLFSNAISLIENINASDDIFDMYLEKKHEDISAILYLDETVTANDLEEGHNELDAALWFISLLSRVDGLVLLAPNLDVLGFGVEIQVREPPRLVVRATDARATKRTRVPLDYTHFGTRHRSMMRFCSKVPRSVGFVVSQDGDVRAMTQLGDELVVWENIRLRLDNFERRKLRKRSP